ncbi:MAG: pyridoxamine 5'-phosphate oxidase family protein [Gammaproteobacteria bacterium]|nr:pyridoxamine 5'-phosphate oxidase family protein [Gammaproteobacteria bacterium]
MSDLNDAREAYLALRESTTSVQLATLGADQSPEASYAPCVWSEGNCYLYLSGLSSHCRNLLNNPKISLLLVDDAVRTANPFARVRASLQGSARVINRDTSEFAGLMQIFHQRFGKVMALIEPLPDFRLFQVHASSGSFIRGFGQAYALSGNALDQLQAVDPRK